MINPSACRISDADLDKLVEHCRYVIDRSIAAGCQEMTPQVIVQAMDPPVGESTILIFVLAMPFNEHEEKVRGMQWVGGKLYDDKLVPMAWVLVSEAWISTQEADEPRKYALPEQDPNRQEAIIFNALTLDGRVRHGYQPVSRDALNRLQIAGPWFVAPADAKINSSLSMQVARGFFSRLPKHPGVFNPFH